MSTEVNQARDRDVVCVFAQSELIALAAGLGEINPSAPLLAKLRKILDSPVYAPIHVEVGVRGGVAEIDVVCGDDERELPLDLDLINPYVVDYDNKGEEE